MAWTDFFTGKGQGSFTEQALRQRQAELAKQQEEDAYREKYKAGGGQILSQGESHSPLGDLVSSGLEWLGLGGKGAYDFGQKIEHAAELSPYSSMKKIQQGDFAGAAEDLVGGPEMAMVAAPAKKLTNEAVEAGRDTLAKIKAFHGSPHDFERFDSSKIGTGEGAQMFGRGLYFAENEGVARQYRDNLARPDFNVTQGGTPVSSDLSRMLEDSYDDAMRQGVSAPSHRDAIHLTQQNLDRQRQDALKAGDFDWFNKVSDQIAELSRMGKDAPATKGALYEVDINADPEHFLDWDKPLSEQAPHVGSALENVVKSRDRMPAEWLGSSPGAEQNMRDAGIPGIKYLDQGSRATGEGSRNYVVFDDKIINIVKKNGIAAALAAGLITESQAAEMRQQGYDE